MTRALLAALAAGALLALGLPAAFVVLLASDDVAGACSDAPTGNTPFPAGYAALVEAAAQRRGLPAPVLAALVDVESGWDAQARSPAGAVGLAQLMPATARSLGVTDLTDPAQSIDGGARYLAAQLRRFGTLRLALAAYNAGPAAVARYGGVPPFPETRAYVVRVLDRAVGYAGGALGGSCVPSAVTAGGWGGQENGRIPTAALTPIGGGLYLRDDAARSFLLMSAAHQRELGAPIGVTDAYRDYATQVLLRRQKPTLAARPGTSEHGWGLAVDLVTGGWDGATMRWLERNAARFGWTHPAWARRDGSKPEHWHWEFADAPAA